VTRGIREHEIFLLLPWSHLTAGGQIIIFFMISVLQIRTK
jgi:hypothetical protein